jgi:hypothetical protein
MRKLLFISGILLMVGAAGVFIACLGRAPFLLGMRWDLPWLIEHAVTRPMAGLWCFAIGCWCLCAGALTFPRVRSRAAFLPFGAAVAIMLLAVSAVSCSTAPRVAWARLASTILAIPAG